jgi:hypothetical protein
MKAPLFSPPNDQGQAVEPLRAVLPDGGTVPVPDALPRCVRAALDLWGVPLGDALAREFSLSLASAFFTEGLFLFPRVRTSTREAVNADLYSMALAGRHVAERRMRAAQDLLFPVVQRDDGYGLRSLDVRDMLRALAGNAVGVDRSDLLAVIERLDMAEEVLREGRRPPAPEPVTVAAATIPIPQEG